MQAYLTVYGNSVCNRQFFSFLETLDRTINDNRHQVTAEVEVTPLTDGGLVIKYADSLRQSLLNDYKEAIANGIHSAYLTGERRCCFVYIYFFFYVRSRAFLPPDVTQLAGIC